MSSRQLRKLQKQRELEQAKEIAAQESEESEGGEAPSPVAAKPRMSLFAALGGEDDNDEDEDEKEEDHEKNQEDSVKREPEPEQTPAPASGKKKKKKKKKGKAQAQAKPEEDDADEIDKALEELKLSGRGQGAASTAEEIAAAGASLRVNRLFGIDTHNLRAVNEMRRLFGRDVIESANAEDEREQNNRRRRGAAQQQVDLETFLRGPPGAKRLPEVSLRRNVFIQGREYWPLASAGGLQMKQLHKAADGSYTEYAYVYDKDYDAIQAVFFAYVGMGDPMRIVYLLQQCPYHVSTLLQVSSVAKQDQNMALASELCERALFTFGRVATSAFRQDLEQGRARLDFRRPENRQFWLAGYHYLKSLIRKGTYKTALEWAKVMFALDHSDPYAMRHFIHLLALRARESQWLLDFLEELENMSDNRDTVYLRQSAVLAKLQLEDKEGAKAALTEGMKQLPWLYCAMYQELGLDAPPSIWGISTDSTSRDFWIKLYLYQAKDLWNNTAATSLLNEVAKSLDKIQTSDLPQDDPPADLGTTRLVYLEGQTSLIACAPRELLDRQPNYEFDPLPPLEEDNIFTGDGCRLPWKDQTQGSRAMEHQIEAQLRNMVARQEAVRAARGGAGVAAPGAFGGFGDDDEEGGNAELDAIDLDDPELRADLEEHARRAQEPGFLNTLIEMLRGRGLVGEGGPGAGTGEEAEHGEYTDEVWEDEQREGPVPGAWPEDENDDEHHGQH